MDNLYKIKDVEIFAEGKWNSKTFTGEDLKDIKTAFESNPAFKPPLKIGHEDEQKLLQKEGNPAIGVIDNLKIVGKKLVADLIDIPEKIYKLIKNKSYRKVSCEIYNNIEIDGTKYPKLLGAVALLGDQMPGVTSLNDILALYAIEKKAVGFSTHNDRDNITIDMNSNDEVEIVTDEKNTDDVLKFKLEQSEKVNSDLSAQLTEMKNQFDAFKNQFESLKTEKQTLDAKLLEVQNAEKAAKLDAFVTSLKAENLISPSIETHVKALFDTTADKFAIGDKTDCSKEDVLRHVLKVAKENAKVNFANQTAAADENVNSAEATHEAIEKFAKENNLSYRDAYSQLVKQRGNK